MTLDDSNSDNLVAVGKYPSVATAAVARGQLQDAEIQARIDGEAMAGRFWHLGSAISGVRLLVHKQDAERAAAILSAHPNSADLDTADYADDLEEEEDAHEEEVSPELSRAFRASIMGFCFLPVLLNIYSLYLLVRHKLYCAPRNWRVGAAFTANVLVLAIAAWLVYMIVSPPNQPPQYFQLDGTPIPVKHETREESIPLVP